MKNHSQDLIPQIKKLKREKISQEEIQEEFYQKEVDLQNEENSCLKILNQGLTEQIKKLKNEKLKKSLDLLSISKSQQSQTIKVSTWFPQTSWIPYHHPNHRSRYNQHQINVATMTNAIDNIRIWIPFINSSR